MPSSFINFDKVISDRGLPLLVKTKPEPSFIVSAIAIISMQRFDNGMRCSFPFFIREAGITHLLPCSSSQRIPRTSPDLVAVNTRNSKASFVIGKAWLFLTVSIACDTSSKGNDSRCLTGFLYFGSAFSMLSVGSLLRHCLACDHLKTELMRCFMRLAVSFFVIQIGCNTTGFFIMLER